MTDSRERKELVDICRMLYDRNLTTSAGGNMSLRVSDGVLITPSGRNKGMLRPDDIVKVDMDGNVISHGRPSMEVAFHLALYKRNGNVNAIVHCHPLYCTALSVVGQDIRSGLTPEGVLLLGDVPMIGYFTPGSKELADAVASNSESMVMLMAKHGAIAQGTSLEDAFNRMEELEFQARLQMLVGDAEPLHADEIQRIRCLK